MGVSENRGPQHSTLNSRILIIRTPKQGAPNFRKLPHECRRDTIPPDTGETLHSSSEPHCLHTLIPWPKALLSPQLYFNVEPSKTRNPKP